MRSRSRGLARIAFPALLLLAAPAAARAQIPGVEGLRRLGQAMGDTTRSRTGITFPADTTTSGDIPPADELYTRILQNAKADTTGVPGDDAPIVYRGVRLVFYPQSEVIVLEGEAAAEQAGTTLAATRILYRSREGIVEAFDKASVSRGPSRLGADSLFYDRQTGVVATFGLSLLEEAGSRTEGRDLRYDLERRSGLLGGGVTQYDPWILEGEQMNKIGETTFVVEEGHFTTCEEEDPHYRFVSHEIKMRQEDVIVGSPVILYFSDVPVFYLPWYVEPIARGRHSGFLRPQLGINTLLFGSGRERNVQDLGYYYVFGDYADAAVAADWYTESRFIIRGDVRYSLRYAFDGNFHVEQVWNRLEDSSSRYIRFNHDHTLGRDSRATVDVNWSNSRSFLRSNSFDPEEILQRSFRSAASYTTRFDWGALVAGSDADFRLDVNRTDFRLADVRLSINQRPLWGRAAVGVGEASERRWYQALQYSANVQGTARLSRAEVDSLGNPVTQTPVDSLGRPLEGPTETILNTQEGSLSLTLSGPLNLGGVIQTTPSLSFSADVDNDELAEGDKLGGRANLNTGLSMSSRFFRVFRRPLGPFQAMRHTVAPSVSVNYAPKPTFWGASSVATANLRETFFVNVNLQQDLDVKIATEDPGEVAEQPADTTAGEDGEAAPPREIPTRTVNLLNVTNSLGYDVAAAREPGKIGLSELSTRIGSGYGESFTLGATLGHSLVEFDSLGNESFSPFLARVTTDFSIRGGGGVAFRGDRGRDAFAGRGAEDQEVEAQEAAAAESETGIGPWSLNLTHSWTRDREGVNNRQSLGIGAQLRPTPAWAMNYQTNYDITNGQFQGQTMSLVRQLHDWTASLNVSFFPAEPQNRVLVTFTVFLTEAPDFEVPYRIRRE
jgi:hypothetical protein